jgi:carbonic anhydrase/acetyltransferase-like protein (isoleucine patch superfamily)
VLLSHDDRRPVVHEDAYVAPTAVVCGDVTLGPNTRVLFGAVVTAESGPVTVGESCVVMEQAVLRGVRRNPLRVGDHCLIGPHAYLTGCTLEDDVFVATSASVFNGAHVEARCEVRIGATVHLRTRLASGTTVPIGWVAVGDPARLFPPDRHEEIWAIQQELDFPGYVFGVQRPPPGETAMPEITGGYARLLGRYRDVDPVA